MNAYTRRECITKISKIGAPAIFGKFIFLPFPINAQGKLQTELAWGGLGFSISASEFDKREFQTPKSLKMIGGVKVLEDKLIDKINSSYLAGLGRVKNERFENIVGGESLVFCVAFDYEQVVKTPSVGESGFWDVESFIFCQSQVLYIDPPARKGAGGEFRVLYSFPFRVQYNFRIPINDEKSLTTEFSKIFYSNRNSIVNVFDKMIAEKKFSEKRFPKAIRVKKIIFTNEFNSSLDFIQLKNELNDEFVGNAFSTSLSEVGGLSVIPFRSNQLVSVLATRFREQEKIYNLAADMGGDDQLDYSIQIQLHRLVRRISGENVANVRVARGMSVFLTLRSENTNEEISKIGISIITDIVLDRISYSENLKSFDLRYLIQMIIQMFDNFTALVVHSDYSKYEKLGLNKNDSQIEIAKFKKVFDECVY